MKKLFAVLALVGVMTSCKDKKKDEKKPEETTTTTPTTTDATTPTETAPTTSGTEVPKFADADVQKYVDDYTAFATGLIDAYKSKDMTKIASLSTKASEWASKSSSMVTKLAANPEDATKFTNYMTKISTDLAEAAKAMMPATK